MSLLLDYARETSPLRVTAPAFGYFTRRFAVPTITLSDGELACTVTVTFTGGGGGGGPDDEPPPHAAIAKAIASAPAAVRLDALSHAD